MMDVKQKIKDMVGGIVEKKYAIKDLDFSVEYPRDDKFGDFATNVSMVLAKKLKSDPMKVGMEVVSELEEAKKFKEIFSKAEVVKPGFINFYLADDFLISSLETILKQGYKFGKLNVDKKLKMQVEFISANPTGPVTLPMGRGGFIGDTLCKVLELAGHEIQREYYVNDIGNQVRILGHSILKDDQAQYSGEYVDELAKRLAKEAINKQDIEKVGEWAAKIILDEMIKPELKKSNIDFDNWFSERFLHESGKVDRMLEELKKRDLVFDKDGAVWLKVADQETDDNKDRVLVKSNGDKTYFLADIAYHWDKFYDRKFDKVINIWGADHHGYVPRLKLVTTLLGYPGQLEILLMQMVKLIQGGKEVRMSKRKGVYVLLKDLVAKVGLDVTRFFFLMHAANKAIDFDLDLAKEKSKNNPVFYVQYAHARICSILKKINQEEKIIKKIEGPLNLCERSLVRELIKWPELVKEISTSYEVHKIPFYVIALADKFHDFYEKCKVVDDKFVNAFRFDLVRSAKQVIENVLGCMGVSSPGLM